MGIRVFACGGEHWLEPCPFCAHDAPRFSLAPPQPDGTTYAQVECPSCHARGPDSVSAKNAAFFWNDARRAP